LGWVNHYACPFCPLGWVHLCIASDNRLLGYCWRQQEHAGLWHKIIAMKNPSGAKLKLNL